MSPTSSPVRAVSGAVPVAGDSHLATSSVAAVQRGADWPTLCRPSVSTTKKVCAWIFDPRRGVGQRALDEMSAKRCGQGPRSTSPSQGSTSGPRARETAKHSPFACSVGFLFSFLFFLLLKACQLIANFFLPVASNCSHELEPTMLRTCLWTLLITTRSVCLRDPCVSLTSFSNGRCLQTRRVDDGGTKNGR